MEEKYLELYNKAKSIFDKYNPCQFKDGLCVRERFKKRKGLSVSVYCCCGGITGGEGKCKYFNVGQGCTVKSLSCQSWICEFASHNIPKKELKILSTIIEEATDLGFYDIRERMEITLKKL